MNKIPVTALIVLLLSSFSLSQDEVPNWKPLDIDGSNKYWYDSFITDSENENKLSVWILQLYRPSLVMEGISDEIYRSKTLYQINLETAKYGIARIIYYNLANEEVFSHNYDNESLSDDIKLTTPVMEDSFIHEIIKEYFREKGEQIN